MYYQKQTIEAAESLTVNCCTCAYKVSCPARHSYTECSRQSGFPLWSPSVFWEETWNIVRKDKAKWRNCTN